MLQNEAESLNVFALPIHPIGVEVGDTWFNDLREIIPAAVENPVWKMLPRS
jgi:hypothetical protein